MNEAFGFDLGGRIRQIGLERPVFIDQLTRPACPVRQHRTRKDELLDLCQRRSETRIRLAV